MSKRIRKRQYKKLHRHYISERQAFSLFSYQAQYIADGLRAFIHDDSARTPATSVVGGAPIISFLLEFQ